MTVLHRIFLGLTWTLCCAALLATAGCSEFGGPVGLHLRHRGTPPREPLTAVTQDIMPSRIERTEIVQKFRERLADACVPNTNMAAAEAPGRLESLRRRLEFTSTALHEFLRAHDEDLVDHLMVGERAAGDASTSPATTTATVVMDTTASAAKGQWPSAVEIYRAYLTAHFMGRYVDRGGGKHSTPDITKKGISNDALTDIIELFFDALFDHTPATRLMVWKDAKDPKKLRYYPAGNTDKPTLALLYEQKGINWLASDKVLEVEDDETDAGGNLKPSPKGQMTISKAKAVGAVAALAEKKSALAGGLIGEAVGGIDVGFIIAGRFSVGDNKTLVEMAKQVLASTSKAATECVALRYLYGHEYSDTGVVAQLLQLIALIEKEQKDKPKS